MTAPALQDPKPPITIIEACQEPEIFGKWFQHRETWIAWFVFLKVMFAQPLDDSELAIFQRCTGRSVTLKRPWRSADVAAKA